MSFKDIAAKNVLICKVTSYADVLRGSSRVPAPDVRGVGTRDEPLRTSPWEDSYARNVTVVGPSSGLVRVERNQIMLHQIRLAVGCIL